MFDAWERFKELLRQCPYHGIPICTQLETFYNGVVPSSRNMLDVTSSSTLLSKYFQEGYDFVESITAKTYQWSVIKVAIAIAPRKPIGVHKNETTNLAF